MGNIVSRNKKDLDLEREEEYEMALQKNEEYICKVYSDGYKVKKIIAFLIKCMFTCNYGIASKFVREKINNIKIRKHSTRTYRKTTSFAKYAGERMAVYTVLFGERDKILEPKVIDEKCDYYVITDQELIENSVWKKIDIDDFDGCSDNISRSRYYKMLHYLLFADYRYTLYIDANIILYGRPTELVSCINPKTGIALHNHPCRNSVYEEIYARKCMCPLDGDLLDYQEKVYKKRGYKSGEGIFECNAILRDNSENCRVIMDAWWEEFKKFPKRDQISLPFVLWNLGIDVGDIGIIGNSIRENPYFRIVEHSNFVI